MNGPTITPRDVLAGVFVACVFDKHDQAVSPARHAKRCRRILKNVAWIPQERFGGNVVAASPATRGRQARGDAMRSLVVAFCANCPLRSDRACPGAVSADVIAIAERAAAGPS
jgi:hypothetical protein